MIDIILAVSFLALMSVTLTGLLVHEWWGIVLMLLVIVHLVAQWDWTMSLTRNLLSHVAPRVRLNYVVNWLLFAAAALVFASGLVISQNVLPTLHLSGARTGGGFWRQMHTLSASAVLILSAIHLGLNWRWVVSASRQLLGVSGARRDSKSPGTRRPIDMGA